MLQRKPEAGRRAIVEYVHGEAIETDLLSEAFDNVGDVVERVREGIAARHVRQAETRQIGRDDMKLFRKQRDQVPKHMAGTWKAVQQQKLRGVGRTGFPIKNLEAIDVDMTMRNPGHGVSPDVKGFGSNRTVPTRRLV